MADVNVCPETARKSNGTKFFLSFQNFQAKFHSLLCISGTVSSCILSISDSETLAKRDDQIDGVAMGSPFVPMLANFFIRHYKKLWLKNYTGPKELYYRRHVFVVSKTLMMPVCFFNILLPAILTLSSLWKQRKRITFHF